MPIPTKSHVDFENFTFIFSKTILKPSIHTIKVLNQNKKTLCAITSNSVQINKKKSFFYVNVIKATETLAMENQGEISFSSEKKN